MHFFLWRVLGGQGRDTGCSWLGCTCTLWGPDLYLLGLQRSPRRVKCLWPDAVGDAGQRGRVHPHLTLGQVAKGHSLGDAVGWHDDRRLWVYAGDELRHRNACSQHDCSVSGESSGCGVARVASPRERGRSRPTGARRMCVWLRGRQMRNRSVCWGTGPRRDVVHFCGQFAGHSRRVVGGESGPQVSWLKDLSLYFEGDGVSKLFISSDYAWGENQLVVNQHWGCVYALGENLHCAALGDRGRHREVDRLRLLQGRAVGLHR